MSERKKFVKGDLVVQDSTMPYPNTIYRVEEVDEHGNFRGPPVFRLTSDPKAYPLRKGQWLGFASFRTLSWEEVLFLVGKLKTLL